MRRERHRRPRWRSLLADDGPLAEALGDALTVLAYLGWRPLWFAEDWERRERLRVCLASLPDLIAADISTCPACAQRKGDMFELCDPHIQLVKDVPWRLN